MDETPAPQARSGASSDGIQPEEHPDVGAPQAHDHLDRLLGDVDLLLRLQLSGYADHDWLRVAEEFARYGVGVTRAWLRRSEMLTRVRRLTGYKLNPPVQPMSDDDIQELAHDTTLAALQAFRSVLMKNKWDPRKGASLRTYFVGQCLWQFPNVYKKWYRRRRRDAEWALVSGPEQLEPRMPALDGPETDVVNRAAARESLHLVSTDKARLAFWLQEVGYSHAEIAEQLGVPDDKAVENLLGYQRRRIQEQRRKKAQ